MDSIKEFYKNQIKFYMQEIEFDTNQINWYGKEIRREKYSWGYSLQGEEYIKQRNYYYTQRKYDRKQLEKYTKLLQEA